MVNGVGDAIMKGRDDERVEGARAFGVCDDGARWYQTMRDAPPQPNCATTLVSHPTTVAGLLLFLAREVHLRF